MIYHVYSSQRTREGERETIIARNLKYDDAREMANRLTEERRKSHTSESSWTGLTFGIRMNKALVEATPELLEALEYIAKECGIMATQCSQRNDTMCLREFAEYQRIATEAIRKAKGE